MNRTIKTVVADHVMNDHVVWLDRTIRTTMARPCYQHYEDIEDLWLFCNLCYVSVVGDILDIFVMVTMVIIYRCLYA